MDVVIGQTDEVAGPSRLRRALSLRTRFTLYLGLTALVTSTLLTVFAFTRARTYLLDQRGAVTRQQTYANANSLLNELRNGDATAIGTFFLGLRNDEDGFAYLYRGGQQRAITRPGRPETLLPEGFADRIRAGQSGQQRFTVDGEAFVAVGVDITAADAQYIEVFPLANTESLIRQIGTALLIGSIIITVLAGGLGWWISRRLLKPVRRVATAAGGIAAGQLSTRLQAESDPELNRLAQSFNDMASAVQTRIERDAQFASDVSHELRSPITALSAAVEVLHKRRDDLPERTQQALTVVVDQVRRFDQMVLDLLELSRLDAGVTDVNREELRLDEVVRRIAQRYGFGDVPLDIQPGADRTIAIDKLRVERILANLLDNARQHGGGATLIRLEPDRNSLLLIVEDAGPGVARGERQRIFERFARGTAARHRVGTGLGLALVAEHSAAMGGETWVEDRPSGGARFVVRFPLDVTSTTSASSAARVGAPS